MIERNKLPISVLIIDDEPSVVEQLELIIGRRVESVFTASNGDEGYKLYKDESPDLIISDIDMPVMNGIELLKLVRADNRHIPFILSTGLKSLDILIQAIEHGITAFLPKPLQIQGLIRKLEEVAHTKVLELEIKNSTALLDQYKNIVDDSVIVSKADTKGIITYVNDMFCKISGYSREELIGKPHNIVRDPNMPSSTFKEIWETIRSKQIWHGVIHNRAKQGNLYIVKSSIAPVLDKDGNIIEYIGLREDITKLEQAKEEATSLAKVKGDFLANMSHEIRTPMNGILGFTDLLSRSVLNEQQKRYLGIIQNSTKTLLSIVNDILDFSKIESGKLELSCISVNPVIEFENIAGLFTTSVADKQIDFEIVIDPAISPFIMMDVLRVQQVVSNLLNNAVKFTPIGGKITFYVSSIEQMDHKERLKIGVRDTGIGISSENQEKIFDVFSQADNSTTRHYGGTGLGLSISSDLVSLMGGKLKVESQQGKGSHFYFDIEVSICDPLVPLIESTTEISDPLMRGNILVVEDNNVNQVLIEEYLQQYHLDYTIVDNGQEALNELEKNRYDLILMDINMPIMSGMEAIVIMRKKGITTPVIALTANVLEGDRKKYLEYGFDNYLSKPIIIDSLTEMLRLYLLNTNKEEKTQSPIAQEVAMEEIVDIEFLKKELALPQNIVYKLLLAFLKSSDGILTELKKATENHDYQEIEYAAHKIRGSAGNMRFYALEELATNLESLAKAKKNTNYKVLYDGFEVMMKKFQARINEILQDNSQG